MLCLNVIGDDPGQIPEGSGGGERTSEDREDDGR